MPWVTPIPDDRTPEEIRIAEDRQRIRQAIPYGWENHHNLLVYGATAPESWRYGICGHRHVCLALPGGWRHPYPLTPPRCDDPPAMSHSGIWIAESLRSHKAEPPASDG